MLSLPPRVGTAHTGAVTAPRTVVVVAFDQLQLLDLAGPIEVFDTADRVAGGGCYRTIVATPGGQRRSAPRAGSRSAPTGHRRRPRRRSTRWWSSVGGAPATLDGRRPVPRRDPGASPVGRPDHLGVHGCARAGSPPACSTATRPRPTGRRATCWARCSEIDVLPDQIYVHDRDRWTSAGVTAGIDLALALVEADHGPELAHEVAGAGWWSSPAGPAARRSSAPRSKPRPPAPPPSPRSSAGSPTTSPTT